MLLLGAPDGKTDMLDGWVTRVFLAADAAQARAAFVSLARELTEGEGATGNDDLVVRRRTYAIGRSRLRVEGVLVSLDTLVGQPLWDEFARC